MNPRDRKTLRSSSDTCCGCSAVAQLSGNTGRPSYTPTNAMDGGHPLARNSTAEFNATSGGSGSVSCNVEEKNMLNLRTGVCGMVNISSGATPRHRGVTAALIKLYYAKFKNSEIPVAVTAQALAFGARWTDEGTLYDPRVGLPEHSTLECDESESDELRVSIGDLISDGINFAMREVETTIVKRKERFTISEAVLDDSGNTITPAKYWYADDMPAAELPGISSINRGHGEQSESRPLLQSEVTSVLKLVYGDDIMTKLGKATEWDTGKTAGTVAFDEGMDRRVEYKLTQWLDTVNEVEEKDNDLLEEDATWLRWSALWYLTPSGQYITRKGNAGEGVPVTRKTEKSMSAQAGALVSRVRRGLVSDDLCGEWGYEDRWCTGTREGMCLDRESINDLNRCQMDEFSEVAAVYAEVEAAAATNLFSSLYYYGGEKLNAFTGAKASADDKPKDIIEARPGEKMPFSEERLYLSRQAHTREANFKRALWNVLTFPLELVEKRLGKNGGELRKQYNNSIKEAAPGPGRAQSRTLSAGIKHDLESLEWRTSGAWVNVPLYGAAAKKWVRDHSTTEWMLSLSASIGGKVVCAKNMRFAKAADWSKTCWRADHMADLQDAIDRRLGYVSQPVLTDGDVTIGTMKQLSRWFRANWKAEWSGAETTALGQMCKATPELPALQSINTNIYWKKYGLKRTIAKVHNGRTYQGISTSALAERRVAPVTQREKEVVLGTSLILDRDILLKNSRQGVTGGVTDSAWTDGFNKPATKQRTYSVLSESFLTATSETSAEMCN